MQLAFAWRRLCSSFKSASRDLCSCSLVNLEGISAFVDCRLIPLDKNPGVRPIGIGEVPRRTISKAMLSILSQEIQEAASPLQPCVGQEGGCVAAIHAMGNMFDCQDVEGALLGEAGDNNEG